MNLTEKIKYYRDRPVVFTRDIIKATPEPYQAQIMQSVCDNSMTTVRSGHGTGKTALESWIILWFLCTRIYPRVPCTAPTKHQLNDILWAEIAKWINNSCLKEELVWTSEKVYLKGMSSTWFAAARTASNPNALQGFHGKNLLFVIDEASGVSDALFQPVLGALTEENAKLLMCGNPTELSGFFYDSHNNLADMYNAFKLDCNDSRRVSKEYIKKIIDMFGIDSDPYRVRVAGDFPKAMPDSFISRDIIDKGKEFKITDNNPTRISIGVDVARFGDDESVIQAVFDYYNVYYKQLQPIVLQKTDTMQLTGRIVQTIEHYNTNHKDTAIVVNVDIGGIGAGVFDRLVEIKKQRVDLKFEVYSINFGGIGGRLNSDDPIAFENKTGLMWGKIRELLQNNRLDLIEDKILFSQLFNRKYRLSSDGKIVLERKEDMKKRGITSPDRADALALALETPNKKTRIGVIT